MAARRELWKVRPLWKILRIACCSTSAKQSCFKFQTTKNCRDVAPLRLSCQRGNFWVDEGDVAELRLYKNVRTNCRSKWLPAATQSRVIFSLSPENSLYPNPTSRLEGLWDFLLL